MKKFLTFILTILTFSAFADESIKPFKKGEISAKIGVGIFLPESSQKVNAKLIALSYTTKVAPYFYNKMEAGCWLDSAPADYNRSNSGYFAYQVGTRVQDEAFYAELFTGVAGITNTDSRLSSNFEFMHDFGVGMQDVREGNKLGIYYKHLSNAGITKPNLGRDFFVIQVGFPVRF